MKLKDILPSCTKDIEITNLTCDSREVEKGSCFVCISGAKEDGHEYAQSAIEKGAAAIICEKDIGFDNQVIVDNARITFAQMAAAFYNNPAKKLKLIAVTGTNGKTSVTYIIKSILENLGKKVGLIGTIQNLIGNRAVEAKNTTPSPLELNKLFSEMVEEGCEYAVMEVSSHALDQNRVYGLEFEVAVFTNLTRDHLDYHITMENYLLAKKKLFSMCKTAVVNADDKYSDDLIKDLNCKIITYSAKEDTTTYSAKGINFKARGVDYEFVGFNVISSIKFAIPGKFSVYNSMSAIISLMELGFNIEDITKAITSVRGIKGRAEIVQTDTPYTVVIDYAHTPDGLLNILSTFKDCPKNRLVCVFGCGGDRDKTKRPIMGEIASRNSDYVIVTSDNPRSEEPLSIIKDIVAGMKNTVTPYKIVVNRAEAIKYALDNAKEGDIIVLAGKGHETYQILDYGTIHLDEREIVADVLKEKK